MMTKKKKMSLVIPAYNEESNIPLLKERLTAFFDSNPVYDFELVIVDDHSTDHTGELVKAWAAEDSRVGYLRLSRNFGSHSALFAGLAECTGDAAAFLAADLQDPPELIPQLAAHWEKGSDVVWAFRTSRPGEKAWVKFTSRVYHVVMKKFVLREMPDQGADFFLMGRNVIDAYLTIPERNADFMNMVLWMGFRQSFIPYVKKARASGISKWTLAKKVKHFVDSVVSFSFAPIRFLSILGLLFALAGFGYALVVIGLRLLGYVAAGTGFAALMVILLVSQGLMMIMLGVMGEYIWRTLDEARRRPRFIIEERFHASDRMARQVVTVGPQVNGFPHD